MRNGVACVDRLPNSSILRPEPAFTTPNDVAVAISASISLLLLIDNARPRLTSISFELLIDNA